MAISTCVLDHLLECHFDALIPRVEGPQGVQLFANTFASCWKFGLLTSMGNQPLQSRAADGLDSLRTSVGEILGFLHTRAKLAA